LRRTPLVNACLLLLVAVLGSACSSPVTGSPVSPGAALQDASAGLRPHAPVTSLVFDPTDARRAYAGTAGSGAGLWSSDDGGQSWRPDPGLVAGQPIYALLASRSGDGTVLAGTERGLWERPPGGRDWQPLGQVPLAPVYVLTEAPDGAVLAGGAGPVIYRRASANASWTPLGPLPGSGPAIDRGHAAGFPANQEPSSSAVLSLASGAGGLLLAGTDGAGLFRSRDGGQTWDRVPEIGGTYVAALAMGPGTAGAGLARTRAGLFRTSDGGLTWSAAASGITDRVDALAVAGDGDFLIGTSIGDLYRSHDAGATWQPWGSGTGRAGLFFALVRVPGQGDRWLAGRETGLYASDDNAASWHAVERGPGYPVVQALARGAGGKLLAATADGVYGSAHDGQSWTENRQGLPPATVLAIAVSPVDGQVAYAGLDGAGLYHSSDGGNHWTRTGWTGPSVPAIALDPHDPEHLFIRVAFERVYESTDGGKHWTARWSGLGLQTQIIALAIDPLQPKVMYAGGTEGFFRSEDGSVTWRSSGPELAGQTIFCLLAGGVKTGELYAGATKGAYRSQDSGEHWEPWGQALANRTVTALAFAPGRPDIAYAGTRYDGIWATRDGGLNWQPAGPGLAGRTVFDLLFTADGRWLLAATDRGVFRTAAP
jgi:photosystem II stability/assembly factor-like uncharacterized protein